LGPGDLAETLSVMSGFGALLFVEESLVGKISLVSVALILFNVALAAIGQIVLKFGTTKLGAVQSGQSPIIAWTGALKSMFTNPYIFAGVAIYAFSAVTWIMILRRVPLSFAYPMISLSYVMVVVLTAVVPPPVRERIPLLAIPGLLLICAGVSLIGVGYGGK